MNEPGFNRPMAEADLGRLQGEAEVTRLRALVDDYTVANLPVMNGSLKYSNFSEGPERLFTLNQYRLWEYVSLLQRLPELGGKVRFLDVGGAGAVLAYALAERGHQGVAVDLNAELVATCAEVAKKRGLALEALVGDATGDLTKAGEGFDLVTLVSVLEHIPENEWVKVFANCARVLRPGGWLYLTFDYGDYRTAQPFGESVRDIAPVLAAVKAAGLRIKGNDPGRLGAEWLERKVAPGHEVFGRQYYLHMGRAPGVMKRLKREVKRVVAPLLQTPTRFAKHNFFRMLLEKN
ncbi:MAG TPA: class I SAM-dependent methyltransferase [Verrucomicrobiae bacterium]